MDMSEQVKEWIVQGPAVSSGALAEHIATEADIQQLRQIAPDVVILAMTPSRAELLKAKFIGLTMASDEDLTLFIK
jgi:hypothetical protein